MLMEIFVSNKTCSAQYENSIATDSQIAISKIIVADSVCKKHVIENVFR